MVSNKRRALVLHINGTKFEVLPENANIPLASFIKAKTPFQSVKTACGEGGCGACTVAVQEERDGQPHLRTLNACLTPVYSLMGRSVLTAEGLPTPSGAPYGTSLVADRLSEFHASQCGYCTPGFTVACHAALHNAAAATGCTVSSATDRGNGCGNNTSSNSGLKGAFSEGQEAAGRLGNAVAEGCDGGGSPCANDGAAASLGGGVSQVVAEEWLLRALDGNLCRCTGYRPIVAACKSLVADLPDIEDLCTRSARDNGSATRPDTRTAAAGGGDGDVSSSVASSYLTDIPLGPGQLLKVPRSLEDLILEAGRLAAVAAEGRSHASSPSQHSWRLVAGHTGPGVFKDWPLQESVLLSVAEVPELKRLEVVLGEDDVDVRTHDIGRGGNGGGYSGGRSSMTQHLRIGACITLERLAAGLAALAAGDASAFEEALAPAAGATRGQSGMRSKDAKKPGGQGGDTEDVGPGVRQWAAQTSSHLYRISGRHVRNAATVGGNLVLARERCLPSDVATPLGAAGAEVELVLVSSDTMVHGSVLRADLLDFVTGDAPQLPPGSSYILTAVRVPFLPDDSRVRFWSQRISERYSNAAALANAAMCLRVSTRPGISGPNGASVTAVVIEDVRIVMGLRTRGGRGGLPANTGDKPLAVHPSVRGPCFASEHNTRKLDDPTVVLLNGWRCVRAAAAEAALRNRPASTAAVVTALEALAVTDLPAVSEVAEVVVSIARGLVAEGLLECLGLAQAATAVDDNGGPTVRLPPPALVEGRQFFPYPVPELLPVSDSIPKLGSKLQASGTALYTEDVPVHVGALYGAFVISARAGGRLAGVNVAAALALPGVVRFLGASDLAEVGPSGALNICDKQPMGGGVFPCPESTFLQVGGRCEFVGQLVGVVLADSQWAAQRGAKAVQLMYDKFADGDAPLLSIADAIRARSFYQLPRAIPFAPSGTTYGSNNSYLKSGGVDVEDILKAAGAPTAAALTLAAFDIGGDGASVPVAGAVEPPCPTRHVRVVSGRYGTPSQLHFYMETQNAVAWPDEDGCVVVHTSCQGCDQVQAGVCTALQLPRHKVMVRCRRVGGGFGGKLSFARRVAVVASIAAVATGRQVRISVPRNTDLAMWGGRCDTDISYVAVLEDGSIVDSDDCTTAKAHNGTTDDNSSKSGWGLVPPRLRALDIHVVMVGGAFADMSPIEPLNLMAAIDSVYDVPAFRLEIALTRCNQPPRTAVRGPGEITGTMIIEQVMEHVAAELGVDAEALREANFLKPPPPPPPAPTPPAAIIEIATTGDGAASSSPSNGKEGTAVPAPIQEPSAGTGTTATMPVPAHTFVKTSLQGKLIPEKMYTLPLMWRRLQEEADWACIKAEVESFNAANVWRKRGAAMIPSRYGMFRGSKPAYVSLLADGSVLVATHGVELGQGLHTKVAQVAALTLSEVLPPSRRPLDLRVIRIADNSTELLPHSGVTAASTTSEMACFAVRLACLKIVENLRKYAVPKMAGREDFGLPDLVAAVTMGAMGCTAPLSAFVWGGSADLPETSPGGPSPPDYHVFGVGLAVVEVDVLTGDRRVLRSDIMFDLGRPINPAVDLGQVEGAFVQGLGMMLQEEVTYDDTTGALVQNSTWNYHPPSVSCVPQRLNVHLLRDAPLVFGGPVSSKACGEPPLLLAAVVLAALQRATAAARTQVSTVTPPKGHSLVAVATGTANGDTQGVAVENGSVSGGFFVPLFAPATVERVRMACGSYSPADLLRLQQP